MCRIPLTEEELMNHLRREGIADAKEVKAAYVGVTGKITVERRGE
jgi:uncharacterized membrane protein YcaP (DUF421 family)